MDTKEKTALIVTDIQNYFFKKGSRAYIRGSGRIIRPVNKLIRIFAERGLKVVFTKQIFPSEPFHPMRRWWKRLPSGEECELFDGMFVPDCKDVIEKTHYSAFFGTRLDKLLRAQGIKRLFFCGVMTHLCVETSIREAFMLGYDSYLVEDAATSKKSAYHKASVLNLGHGFCKVIKSEDVDEYI